ncbi:lipid-A-disaccharide synthase [Roseibium hamelinense]|uniref:Lipid-A-disaccharide synthase n=1 Tax=Roseibium hamelinense TaxID=150831 RepID=A0A562TGW1_9HYPH|nr:lipid-A-disaccharide synthase [Roseibium hamelinense]MTI45960.1 lipid-A-disaccharide synthase [Roseibium hamelinense]TWI92851.1 lipid-A-disaccharide synthase [Roseibium hamelinense]
MNVASGRPARVCLVMGEESGDQLGAELMKSLKERLGADTVFTGLGGERTQALGLKSFFDMSDVSVMGLSAVLARLPLIVKRVYQTVDGVIAADPDVLVIIDSPDFTHNVAKRVRKRAPHIPIVGYVSPSVWAWRPGRARKMRAYVDELLALLPFEPQAHERLGGPRTHYVGHPLSENVHALRPAAGERSRLRDGSPVLLVLPGSRGNEITRLLPVFKDAVAKTAAQQENLEILLPAVAHLEDRIREAIADWPVKPQIVFGVKAKRAAFRRAHAALAASGTVSLELALAGVPMVIAYKVDWFFRRLKDLNAIFKFSSVDSMVLPNIVLGEKAVPEFLDDDADPDTLSSHLVDLLKDSPERARQQAAFARLDAAMRLPDGYSQSRAAADVVIQCMTAPPVSEGP